MAWAGSGLSMAAMVVVVCFMWALHAAGRGEAVDCTTTVSSVAGCASFFTNPSSKPDSKTCCQPLQKVLSSPESFQCICSQASTAGSSALKNALLLPQACNLDINVSASNCSNTPPASGSPGTPSTSKTPSSPGNSGSAGFISAFPYSPLAVAFLCCLAFLFCP